MANFLKETWKDVNKKDLMLKTCWQKLIASRGSHVINSR